MYVNKCVDPSRPSVSSRLIGVVEILPQSVGVTLALWCVDSGLAPSQFPLGEVQLTLRHSPQRNKLIVVVHACRSGHAPPQKEITSHAVRQLEQPKLFHPRVCTLL